MKILWLYQYKANYNFDHWLHMSMVKYIREKKDYEIQAYGLNLEKGYPNLCLTPYHPSLTMQDLYNKFNFDVVVVSTKSRMWENYLPIYALGNLERIEKKQNYWLPNDFSTFHKTPKVVLEEDYHYEANDSWYDEVKIDAILHRHHSNVLRGKQNHSKVKHIWHPFSVDTTIFKDYNQPRQNQICYTGSINAGYYKDRQEAYKILSEKGLINPHPYKVIADNEYVINLNSFICHLSGNSIYHITPGKIFEIMACGSLLFTSASEESGIPQLFSDNTYIRYRWADLADVEKQAIWILNNQQEVKEMTTRAKKEIQEKHSHDVRMKEFEQVVRSL